MDTPGAQAVVFRPPSLDAPGVHPRVLWVQLRERHIEREVFHLAAAGTAKVAMRPNYAVETIVPSGDLQAPDQAPGGEQLQVAVNRGQADARQSFPNAQVYLIRSRVVPVASAKTQLLEDQSSLLRLSQS
jgi:hypothetical protein